MQVISKYILGTKKLFFWENNILKLLENDWKDLKNTEILENLEKFY